MVISVLNDNSVVCVEVMFLYLITGQEFYVLTLFCCCCCLEKPSQNSENEQSSVSLEVLLVKVCHKKRKVKFPTSLLYFAREFLFHIECVLLISVWIFFLF